jgi:hypothetical protein
MLTNNIHSQLLSVSKSNNNKTKTSIPPMSAMHTAIKKFFLYAAGEEGNGVTVIL